jgi:hypothetical protein
MCIPRKKKKKPENQKYGSFHHPWRTDTDVAKAGCLYKLAICGHAESTVYA